MTAFGHLRNWLANARTLKLSTVVVGLFAVAILFPWTAFAWLTLSERSEQVMRTEQSLGALAAAYGEHAAALARLGTATPYEEEMAAFGRALNVPGVRFSLSATGAEDNGRPREPVLEQEQGLSTTFSDSDGIIAAQVTRAAVGISVASSMSEDEALKSWREKFRVEAAVLVFRTLLILCIGIFLVQQLGLREKLQAELTIAQRTAESSNRAKSEFLANMSHELRTPLNAIIGFSEVMRNQMFGPVSDRYRDYAADILGSGRHLLALINEILDLSKLEAGQLKLHEEDVDLAVTVEDCLTLVEPQAQRAGIRFVTSLDDTASWVRADKKRLTQILLNLLSNAVKFTPKGGEVQVVNFHSPEGLAIAVSDTGIGMAPEDIPKAMMPFGQVDSTISRQHEGTGLGLPLSKHLAELHGGRLRIESTINAGTTVTIILPHERVIASPRLAVA